MTDENVRRDVYMYYAYENGVTQGELATKFGISRERVGQCIKKVRRVASGTAYHNLISKELKRYNA